MCKKDCDCLVNKIYEKFQVNCALCEVIKRRWSYVTGTEDFICGNQKLMIDDDYGLILDCDEQKCKLIQSFVKDNQQLNA